MSDAHSTEDIKKHVRVYMMVFGALAVLTVVTVAVSYLHLPILPAIVLGLAIASVKAGLVAAHFMHLKSEKKVIFATLIGTGVFFACMVIIFIAAQGDHAGSLISY